MRLYPLSLTPGWNNYSDQRCRLSDGDHRSRLQHHISLIIRLRQGYGVARSGIRSFTAWAAESDEPSGSVQTWA